MKLVILDRDGVINFDSDAYIKSPEEWLPIPGSLHAIARLHRAGFAVVVATNQAGVSRGLFDLNQLEAIHNKLQTTLEATGGKLAGIFYCPHRPEDSCDCRKPKTGLFRQIEKRFNLSLKGVPAIGDSFRDIEAARSVGARAILVRTGKGEATLRQRGNLAEVEIYADLAAAANKLIKEMKV